MEKVNAEFIEECKKELAEIKELIELYKNKEKVNAIKEAIKDDFMMKECNDFTRKMFNSINNNMFF